MTAQECRALDLELREVILGPGSLFTLNERDVLSTVLDFSFRLGRARACFIWQHQLADLAVVPRTKVKEVLTGLMAGGVLIEHQQLVFEVSGGHEFWGKGYRRSARTTEEWKLRSLLASLDPEAPIDRKKGCVAAARELFTQAEDLHGALARLTALGFLPAVSADAFTQSGRPRPVSQADVPGGRGGTAGRCPQGAAADEGSSAASPATRHFHAGDPDFTGVGANAPAALEFTKGEVGKIGIAANAGAAQHDFTKGEVTSVGATEFTKGEVYSSRALEQKAKAVRSGALKRYSSSGVASSAFKERLHQASTAGELVACAQELFGESMAPPGSGKDFTRFWHKAARNNGELVRKVLLALTVEEMDGIPHPNIAGCGYKMFLEWVE